MVPDVGSWNYAFSGVKWSAGMKYGLRLANPKPFFDEAHRAHHFLEFVSIAGADCLPVCALITKRSGAASAGVAPCVRSA
jgi:hypothetical protein